MVGAVFRAMEEWVKNSPQLGGVTDANTNGGERNRRISVAEGGNEGGWTTAKGSKRGRPSGKRVEKRGKCVKNGRDGDD